jgi:hypothetical protein
MRTASASRFGPAARWSAGQEAELPRIVGERRAVELVTRRDHRPVGALQEVRRVVDHRLGRHRAERVLRVVVQARRKPLEELTLARREVGRHPESVVGRRGPMQRVPPLAERELTPGLRAIRERERAAGPDPAASGHAA